MFFKQELKNIRGPQSPHILFYSYKSNQKDKGGHGFSEILVLLVDANIVGQSQKKGVGGISEATK